MAWTSQHDEASRLSTGRSPMDTLTVQLAELLQDQHCLYCKLLCVNVQLPIMHLIIFNPAPTWISTV